MKKILVGIVLFYILVCITQIFPIPPFAKDINHLFPTGYFRELKHQSGTILDAFLNIKMYSSKQEYAWVYLKDLEDRYGIRVDMFNSKGVGLSKPGFYSNEVDSTVQHLIGMHNPGITTRTTNGKIQMYTPILFEDRCRVCHEESGKIAGVSRITRNYDGHIYYTMERIIIFTCLLLMGLILLFVVLRWEPHRGIKELFDKTV